MLSAPKVAIDKLLRQTGRKASDIHLWEINEAFRYVKKTLNKLVFFLHFTLPIE
jgi:acetyl-CoA acetyltransferase